MRAFTRSPMLTMPTSVVVLDDGHVPEPALGHDAGEVLDLVGGPARGDARGHDVGDAQLQEPGPAEVQPPHDVALGDDADEALASSTGSAPTLCSASEATRSATDVDGSTVATDEPLPRRTSAIRMIWSPLSSPLT